MAFEYLKKYANFNRDESQGAEAATSEHGHPASRFRKIRKRDSVRKKEQDGELDMINRRKVVS